MSQPHAGGIIQFFAYDHLPPHLAEVAELFADLARELEVRLPQSAELTAGLRKLLEAKDCAVRATVAAAAARDADGAEASADLGPC